MYLGRRDREVVYIYIPISFDAEISWRRTYSDNESTSPRKIFLGPGFQVSVSLYLYSFSSSLFSSSSGNVEDLPCSGFGGNGKAGAFGFGIMWKTGRCDSGMGLCAAPRTGFIHCGCRRCCAVCLGGCARRVLG